MPPFKSSAYGEPPTPRVSITFVLVGALIGALVAMDVWWMTYYATHSQQQDCPAQPRPVK